MHPSPSAAIIRWTSALHPPPRPALLPATPPNTAAPSPRLEAGPTPEQSCNAMLDCYEGCQLEDGVEASGPQRITCQAACTVRMSFAAGVLWNQLRECFATWCPDGDCTCARSRPPRGVAPGLPPLGCG